MRKLVLFTKKIGSDDWRVLNSFGPDDKGDLSEKVYNKARVSWNNWERTLKDSAFMLQECDVDINGQVKETV